MSSEIVPSALTESVVRRIVREEIGLLDLNGDAVLGGNLADLLEVKDSAHGGEASDAKCVDPRIRLIDYREVDGHRLAHIDGVADPLVGRGDPVSVTFDGSAVNRDAAHASPSVVALVLDTPDAVTTTVGDATGSTGSPSGESVAPSRTIVTTDRRGRIRGAIKEVN